MSATTPDRAAAEIVLILVKDEAACSAALAELRLAGALYASIGDEVRAVNCSIAGGVLIAARRAMRQAAASTEGQP